MAMQISGFAVAEEVFVIKTSDIIPYDTCVAGLREALSAYSGYFVSKGETLFPPYDVRSQYASRDARSLYPPSLKEKEIKQ